MYRVVKDYGNNANVIVENIETKANVMIGKLSYDIIDLLNKRGYKVGEDGKLSTKEAWNFEIDIETKDELTKKAMRMTKPIRNKSKQPVKDILKKPKKDIDAMDVLLGLADYN